MLERELERVKDEKSALHSEIDRYQKLVYGSIPLPPSSIRSTPQRSQTASPTVKTSYLSSISRNHSVSLSIASTDSTTNNKKKIGRVPLKRIDN